MLKKIVRYLLNFLSVVIILASLFILVSVVMVQPGKTPSVFGFSAFRVMTGSMAPTIPTGSLIVVRERDPAEIAVGDVITFYSRDPALAGVANTHRVKAVAQQNGRRLFTTEGDANLIEDAYPVDERDVIGVVVFSSLFLGRLIKLLSNPLVFVPLILVPLVVILILNMVKTVRLTKTAVRAEEEQAVREILEAVRKQRAQSETSADDAAERPSGDAADGASDEAE